MPLGRLGAHHRYVTKVTSRLPCLRVAGVPEAQVFFRRRHQPRRPPRPYRGCERVGWPSHWDVGQPLNHQHEMSNMPAVKPGGSGDLLPPSLPA